MNLKQVVVSIVFLPLVSSCATPTIFTEPSTIVIKKTLEALDAKQGTDFTLSANLSYKGDTNDFTVHIDGEGTVDFDRNVTRLTCKVVVNGLIYSTDAKTTATVELINDDTVVYAFIHDSTSSSIDINDFLSATPKQKWFTVSNDGSSNVLLSLNPKAVLSSATVISEDYRPSSSVYSYTFTIPQKPQDVSAQALQLIITDVFKGQEVVGTVSIYTPEYSVQTIEWNSTKNTATIHPVTGTVQYTYKNSYTPIILPILP